MKKLLAIALMILLLTGSCAAAQENSPALWRVKNGDTTVYLFGSIHIGNPGMYPLSQPVQDAMAQADEFVFECDTTSGDALVLTQTAMVYLDGTRLRDVIGQELFDKAVKTCEKSGIPTISLDAYRPWTVTNMLTLNASALQLGTDNVSDAMTYGVEIKIQEQLKGDQRPVSYLEQTADQLAVMDGFSLELQKYLLSSVCDIILDPTLAQDSPIKYWADWWRLGDVESFAKSYYETYIEEGYEEVSLEYHRDLITKRNLIMADGVKERLERGDGRAYFVTVGFLHLALSDDSVLTALEDMGYPVERIE